MRESAFQSAVIRELKSRLPGCIVIKNDPNYIQGFPDLLVLYGTRWGALECKVSSRSRIQPNQEYYIDLLDEMSYASFICPDNKEDVLDEIQLALRPRGEARIFKR